jgi:hypothetical protein
MKIQEKTHGLKGAGSVVLKAALAAAAKEEPMLMRGICRRAAALTASGQLDVLHVAPQGRWTRVL